MAAAKDALDQQESSAQVAQADLAPKKAVFDSQNKTFETVKKRHQASVLAKDHAAKALADARRKPRPVEDAHANDDDQKLEELNLDKETLEEELKPLLEALKQRQDTELAPQQAIVSQLAAEVESLKKEDEHEASSAKQVALDNAKAAKDDRENDVSKAAADAKRAEAACEDVRKALAIAVADVDASRKTCREKTGWPVARAPDLDSVAAEAAVRRLIKEKEKQARAHQGVDSAKVQQEYEELQKVRGHTSKRGT